MNIREKDREGWKEARGQQGPGRRDASLCAGSIVPDSGWNGRTGDQTHGTRFSGTENTFRAVWRKRGGSADY